MTANRFLGAIGLVVALLVAVIGLAVVPGEPASTPDDVADRPAAEPRPAAPRPPATTRYAVQPGDTVWTIAHAFGTTVQTIVDINDLDDPHTLDVGQTLRVPNPTDPYALPAMDPGPAR